MKNHFFLLLTALFFTACQSDHNLQEAFAGSYRVTLDVPGHDRDMDRAREDMEEEIDSAKKDIEKELKEARKDIKDEFGEESRFGEALENFVEDMSHFAEGMTEFGRAMGELGLSLGTGILKDVRFTAVFQPDGDVVFGKKRGLKIKSSDQLRWKIDNGDMLLWNEGDSESDAERFEISENADGWILTGEDVIFHLERLEEE